MDGRSMKPLVDGSGGWPNPRAIGIELGTCEYRGIRYERQVYFQYASETETGGCTDVQGTELYDLEDDPYQLLNLATLDQYDTREAQLRALTNQMSTCSGIANRDPEPASGQYCQ
jgi:arylsulfatase A-like enzyme